MSAVAFAIPDRHRSRSRSSYPETYRSAAKEESASAYVLTIFDEFSSI